MYPISKEGHVFKDITPVLNDPVLFRASIDLFWSGAAARIDRCGDRCGAVLFGSDGCI